MADKKIKYIESASWFKTMEHYPKTVGHVKLLVSIVDKVGIMDRFNLQQMSDMNSDKLNIFYAILRIMNKIFNKYLDYAVKKIFMERFQKIFATKMDLTNNELFFDQLTQDIDHFVCYTTKSYFPNMNETIIKNKFVSYLRTTFNKIFYGNITKKIGIQFNDKFFMKYDPTFTLMINEFVNYSKDVLKETFETMKLFLEKIFSKDCTTQTINDIIKSLEKHIDLKSLFNEECMEIAIYSEQKLDDEFERSENSLDFLDDEPTNDFKNNHTEVLTDFESENSTGNKKIKNIDNLGY